MRAPNFKTPLTCCPQKCTPSSLKTRSDKTRKQTTPLGEPSPENRALQYMFSVTRTMLSAASLRAYSTQAHCGQQLRYCTLTARSTVPSSCLPLRTRTQANTSIAQRTTDPEVNLSSRILGPTLPLYFKFKELEREKWFTRQNFPRKRSKDRSFPLVNKRGRVSLKLQRQMYSTQK